MSDFINSTVNTKIYNLMSDEHQIIIITDKEAIVENIGTIVSGDTNSCLLTFEINRFQDGIDLSDKKIRFNYRNSNGKFYDIAVNVKYNDDVIKFSWLLPYSLTQPGGNVIASIEFYGSTEYDEHYSYKTKNFKLSVEKSLGVDDGSDESYNNWTIKIENDVEAIQNKIVKIEKEVKSIHVPTKLSEMVDDAEHRTVSDSQIQAWDEVHKNSQADWNEENTNSSAYIKNKPQIPTVTNDLTDELKSNYDEAVTNSHVHNNKSVIDDITAEKVSSWDNKVNDSDLAVVAKTGSYNDLNDIPDSLPASDVYQWAKQSQKPTYTADEVGALPKDTEIPSKTSDLRNDSGFLKQPSSAQVGQIFRVQSINEDGTLVLEAVDMPSGGSGGGGGIHLISRVVTESNAVSIEVTGLSTTAESLSLRIYNLGSSCGNGLTITVNGVKKSGYIGGMSGGSVEQASVRAWLYRDDGILHCRAVMANLGINLYEWLDPGEITSIVIASPYNDGTTKYLQAGTIFEIYEGVYPNVS